MPPFFYLAQWTEASVLELDADTSHHIAQVLRMRTGEAIRLTDGKGNLIQGQLASISKRSCTVRVEQRSSQPRQGRQVHLAIAPPKHASRLEWFIEKATELGIDRILLIRTARTEKDRWRMDRIRQVSVAAMLQSQQVWLPDLSDSISYKDLIESWKGQSFQRLIAHCLPDARKPLAACTLSEEVGLLIGPEGDFTSDEIEMARAAGFTEVQLGETRLRTETAGVVGASFLRLQS